MNKRQNTCFCQYVMIISRNYNILTSKFLMHTIIRQKMWVFVNLTVPRIMVPTLKLLLQI